jgi:hypothetical protein
MMQESFERGMGSVVKDNRSRRVYTATVICSNGAKGWYLVEAMRSETKRHEAGVALARACGF